MALVRSLLEYASEIWSPKSVTLIKLVEGVQRRATRDPFYMRTVQSQTGTKITHVGSATDTKSDRSEFIFRPVPCKRMKRNVWRAIRTHTGLSPSRSHAITSLLSYRSETVPFSCKNESQTWSVNSMSLRMAPPIIAIS